MQLPPIATTTVGSFPRPNWLSERDRSEVTFRLEGELLSEAQDDATIAILHEQERVGLDLLTDGEQRRPQFINHVLAAMDGFDLVNRRDKAIRRRTDVERQVPRVVGPVRRRAVAVVGDFLFAKAHTSRPVKMAVPGPMTVVDTTYDEFYGDEEKLAMDVAAALNEELLALQAAGCDVAQIDEPAMTRYHEKAAAYGVRALDRCLQGVTIPTIVHLCYGYPGAGKRQHEYEYPELLELLMKSRVGGFSVEFARSGFDPAVLDICKDRLIVFGCVDPGDTPPEPLEKVVARVGAALDYIEPERLLLAPDCGLMTVSRELALEKARLLVQTASELRRSL
ncbi:MAG TPA: 5-methyltetrahydropteroyltriglutamate--homocysteine methyltransferase [Candidatus Binatia bacterium]|jgi:5-methyltetrahydropteroyltriglutamate--homocysteine methyltransferase